MKPEYTILQYPGLETAGRMGCSLLGHFVIRKEKIKKYIGKSSITGGKSMLEGNFAQLTRNYTSFFFQD